MTGSYYNPVRSAFGAGALARLPEFLHERSAVLVTFPEARDLGLVARVQALLKDNLRGVIDTVQPNPDVAELATTYDRFWRDRDAAEVIIALGGGSAIDTAKVLMVGTSSGTFAELIGVLARGDSLTPQRVK